jgi:hypothetical protein
MNKREKTVQRGKEAPNKKKDYIKVDERLLRNT